MARDRKFKAYNNPDYQGFNIFKQEKTNVENQSKSERVMNTIAWRAGYYRENPHRLCSEYLKIQLKTFQKILLYFMMHFHYFMYLASRGQGKSFLTAIFCCVYSILYPGVKIIVASGRKSQSREVIEKIVDLMESYPNLAREISEYSTSTNDPYIKFKAGSSIRTVASNDGARSKRCNILVVDEFRMVDPSIINKVLRKFMTAPRQPRYLNNPKYKHLQERNKELYLSSAFYKHHWSYEKFKAYTSALSDGKQYFVCGLPYQLPIKENLLMREQVLDEMSENDFDAIGWLMEMECMWFGENEKSFFKLEELNDNRRIYKPLYPKPFYDQYKSILTDNKFKYEEKIRINGKEEIRLVSCDVSGMGNKNNDASVYTIFRLIPRVNGYERQVVYMESYEGGHTVIQATRIRQLFEDFDCDYIVLDTQGIGLGIYDQLCTELYDKERDKHYEAFSCINNKEMAERCLYADSPLKIYSIKADQSLNTQCATSLKDNLKRGKLKLLVNDLEAKETLNKIKGNDKLTPEEKAKFMIPYLQTTLFINEIINLEAEYKDNGNIKLKEPRNGRKDRYSSITYGNYISNILERSLLTNEEDNDDEQLVFY